MGWTCPFVCLWIFLFFCVLLHDSCHKPVSGPCHRFSFSVDEDAPWAHHCLSARLSVFFGLFWLETVDLTILVLPCLFFCPFRLLAFSISIFCVTYFSAECSWILASSNCGAFRGVNARGPAVFNICSFRRRRLRVLPAIP